VNELIQNDFVRFGGKAYLALLTLLVFARGMDFLSTYIATPNLVLEGNPFARRLGWRWGIPLNLTICFLLARWPVPAIVLITTSLLVAARNFQSAWLMRTLGEHFYRDWHVDRLRETSPALYVFCLLGQTGLIAMVGLAVIYFSDNLLIPTAIGMGIIAYAFAVLGFTLFAVWRLRRAYRYLAPDQD
jgi:hypothetical protein